MEHFARSEDQRENEDETISQMVKRLTSLKALSDNAPDRVFFIIESVDSDWKVTPYRDGDLLILNATKYGADITMGKYRDLLPDISWVTRITAKELVKKYGGDSRYKIYG